MTKLCMPIVLSIIALQLFNCASIDTRPISNESKQAQLEKESFRYQLPVAENKPTKPVFPKVIKNTLKNGLTVLVVEDRSLPIAQISVVFKNGSSRDPFGRSGLINLTAQMLNEGTAKMNSLELAEAFANLGTTVSVNASKDSSSLSAAVLSNKAEEAMGLLAAMVETPRFDAEDFFRIRLQQESAIITDQADPNYLAQVKFLRAAYGDKHPYAYPSAGTLEAVKKIELKDIKKTYESYFGPNNAALVVVGDVSVDEVMKAANKDFGSWHKIKESSFAIKAPVLRKNMQTVLVEVPDMPQTYLLVGQPAALRTDKDLASYEVFLNILARDPTSRLNVNLREQKGWTYGVRGIVNPLRGLGPLWISTSVQVPYGSEALQEILNELQKLQTTPVSDAELKSAKEGLLHSFASRYTTVSKVANQAAELFIYDLPLDNDQVFYEKLAQVSQDEIMAVAKKALRKDQMVAIAVGDLEAIETPLKAMDVGAVKVERAKSAPPAKTDEAKKTGKI